eukprot:scaffold256039_cov32-Prasinocladus_malaysianus.AAC.1
MDGGICLYDSMFRKSDKRLIAPHFTNGLKSRAERKCMIVSTGCVHGPRQPQTGSACCQLRGCSGLQGSCILSHTMPHGYVLYNTRQGTMI